MINQQTIHCDRQQHQNQTIIALCTKKNCKIQRTCCATCLNDHNDHLNKIEYLLQLQLDYVSPLNPFYEVRDKILSQINLIEKAILELPSQIPEYPKIINLANLNEFGAQIASQTKKNVQPYINIKQDIENVKLIIQASLQRLYNLIRKNDKIYQEQLDEAKEFMNEGSQSKDEGFNEEALKLYNKSLEIYDQNSECWRLKERYEEANECYDQALNIDPKNSENYLDKCGCLLWLNRDQESLIYANQGLKMDSENINMLNGKGIALYRLHRYEEAKECFLQANQLQPKKYLTLYNLGSTLEKQGKQQEAIEYYQQTLEINDNFQDARTALNRLIQASTQ